MKRITKRILPALLSCALCLSLTACGSGEYDAEKQALHDELYGAIDIPTASAANISLFESKTANFCLAYSRSDSLNPYKAKSTLNTAVSDLIFDKLFILNSKYEVEPIVARTVEQKDSRTVEVTVRTGLVFSDGSKLTVDDVEYSFYSAKRSTTKYKNQLSNFKACSKKGNTLIFQLGKEDPLAYMLLDFPIIKKESDVGGNMPIGSGRYVYITDADEGMFLELNQKWYDPEKPSVERISLTAMPTIESIVHSIEIGTVSYYITDLRDGYPNRVSCQYATYDLNNLVYLGINTNDSRLLNIDIRTAISCAVDRDSVVTKAYNGKALAATGPLTVAWQRGAEMQSGGTKADKASAEFLLNNAGYVNKDEAGLKYDSLGNYLTFTILVNSANDAQVTAAKDIALKLSDVGVKGIVEAVEPEDFTAALKAGEYQLYIAEYAMMNDMDYSALHTPGGKLYTGATFDELDAAQKAYLTGEGKMDDYIAMTEKYLPFIPLCHRQGMVCFSRALAADMDVSESEPFYHMNAWKVLAVEATETEEGTSSAVSSLPDA